MASATGIPQHTPIDPDTDGLPGPDEPLLGRPGDASQGSQASIAKNLIIGTGIIAEASTLLLFASVWAAVFMNKLILFSVHPLAQSFGFLVLVQSVLVLQPTHTGSQKKVGQRIHAGLNLLALASFIVGVVVIEVNKFKSNGPHFHSVHGYLGVITSIWIIVQYGVGFTMWATPKLYGSEENAKKIWKYHRMNGYVLFLLMMATITSAVETDFNKNVLGLKLWAMIIIMVLLVVGIYPRIKKQKLGL
ncbi:Uu.00g071190.m01.CDS01 [Anthostomella pinea]|uniref:Uu.00g071190.m01.CDS01 n=1 Tax=Anthostomella pinea TaxID=933095 RepID=A0AAI8YNL8_9PEZI|nr:Uu.00g071190.m01.CDS01 [Anthostomella pinea]